VFEELVLKLAEVEVEALYNVPIDSDRYIRWKMVK